MTCRTSAFAAALGTIAATSLAAADPVSVEAVMVPQEQMRLDFEDGSNQFVLLVRREGTAAGEGLLDGLEVTEYGMHPIRPGVGGSPRGYLEFADADGDKIYVDWSVRAVFVPGPDGAPRLLDNGSWEIAGATGKYDGLQGAGSLNIRAVTPTDRNFILDGELVTAD